MLRKMSEQFVLSNDPKGNKLVKSPSEVSRWLWKKFDIRGVVFFSGPQQYMWYVEVLRKTYNEGDRTFYDAIKGILICWRRSR